MCDANLVELFWAFCEPFVEVFCEYPDVVGFDDVPDNRWGDFEVLHGLFGAVPEPISFFWGFGEVDLCDKLA